jgi:hypothetical protein
MKDIPLNSISTEHHIQRSILLQVRQYGPQSYQALKPDGLEGNAYNYHLKNLKQAKLVEIIDSHYHLTPMGHIVADAYSLSNQKLVLRPHFYTHLLVTNQAKDKVLLYTPTRQPMPGKHGLFSGKFHFGDTFALNIKRELMRRKLNDSYTIRSLCPISVQYRNAGDIVMHRPGNLWHIIYKGELVISTTDSGSAKWFSISELSTQTNVLPEVTLALKRLVEHSFEPIDFIADLS